MTLRTILSTTQGDSDLKMYRLVTRIVLVPRFSRHAAAMHLRQEVGMDYSDDDEEEYGEDYSDDGMYDSENRLVGGRTEKYL